MVLALALILLCTRSDLQYSYITWTDGVSSDPPVYQVRPTVQIQYLDR